jgi:hypothetical protein
MGSGPRLKKSSQDPKIRLPTAHGVVAVDESLSIVHGKVHTVRRAEDISIIAVEAAKTSTQVRATAYWPACQDQGFSRQASDKTMEDRGIPQNGGGKSVRQSNLESGFFNHIPAFHA